MRNHQVLSVPKTPTAKVAHHAAEHEGTERARGMAPPMRITPGWWRPQLFLAHYLCSVSCSNALYLEQWRTQEWKKPPPLQGVRSVTSVSSSASRYQIVVRWELPSLFNVLTTAARSSWRNSLAQLESMFVIDSSPFPLSTVVIGYATLLHNQQFCVYYTVVSVREATAFGNQQTDQIVV